MLNSDTRIASQKATKTAIDAAKAYADGLVVGLIDDRGNYDASTNVFPSAGGSGAAGAILKGDIWIISVAGALGGVAVNIGDQVRALTNTPGQTAANWAVSEANIGYVPASSARTIGSGAGLTGGGDLSGDRTLAVGAGTGITVNADDVALDTANTRNVDHTAVSVIAGAGLTGGGTIAADRTVNVGAGTGITVNADDVALDTSSTRNTDHTAVTLTAGAGLTGGGDISTGRTFAVGAGAGITVNADDVAITAGQVPGTATNDDAGAGKVGEYVESIVTSGSAVPLTSGTAANVTSISLTAGDWEVDSQICYSGNSSTSLSFITSSISLVSATLDATVRRLIRVWIQDAAFSSTSLEMAGGRARLSLNATTTVYLISRAHFTVSTCSTYGGLFARRMR